ncbi:protein SPIRAL1-like 1 [Sesamum angolense]|uniref:Protein SPIRAL1-like 1 n=1 Tax=Sesamum angolense TaxID=2727404 RepID=A0AAE1WV70_9LAMI|nr:protein SPIRAL1-like 1 [Sesamum angolense]
MSGISLSGRSDLKAAEVEFCDLGIGEMGRGVSCGGGQSSLGYLFGSGEAPKPAKENVQSAPSETKTSSKPNAPAQPVDISKQIPAGINTSTANNYVRTDGQNTGNFITKVLRLHGRIDHQQRSMLPPEEALLWVTCLVATKGDFKTASLI